MLNEKNKGIFTPYRPTALLHWPKVSIVCLLKRLSSFLNGTWIVVRSLAAFHFTPSGGTLFLTFVTYLKQSDKIMHEVPHSTQIMGEAYWYFKLSVILTSCFPRFTSVITSFTEKPNRSSNCGELWQYMPEENNCKTEITPVRTKSFGQFQDIYTPVS